MKRYGNLYSKIYSLENLKLAHKNASKDKKFYREVKMVDSDEEYYLLQIQDMLKNKTYKVSPYKTTIINDKGKEREISKLPYFPDRIIQWAILLQTEKVFRETFIHQTCSSIPCRGIHRALKYESKYLRKFPLETTYCYKIDVRKFYPSINHKILKNQLRKKFKDVDLLWLFDLIIDSYVVENDIVENKKLQTDVKGVAIGSYLSQYLANFSLSYFDHYAKEVLKCKFYIRYADDIVIFGETKQQMHDLHKKISEYFIKNLDLEIKGNWQIFSVEIRGVDFLGYRHFRKFILLRKSTVKNIKKLVKKINRKPYPSRSDWSAYNSYGGWVKWCDSRRLKRTYFYPLAKAMRQYYFRNVKCIKKR